MQDFLEHEGERKPVPVAPHAEPAGAVAEVRVGLGSCCVAGGSDQVRQALEEALEQVDTPVHIKHVSCVGMCHQTPLLEFVIPGSPPRMYAKVQAEDVPDIVAHILGGEPVARLTERVDPALRDLILDILESGMIDL